ncbi:hypothetical protein BDV33DRAFT_204447 [Aspergillus novoparasiticus]|uniref:Transcription factor domain-containing protein n=1 Tax=Aspergillus novoparasiticus TaxID=986946 RepID=A0A5N6EPK0_9EURO|nr:hypothetical protein BDV33DRAFT_204447 [Aspergillus novoparasiticus]
MNMVATVNWWHSNRTMDSVSFSFQPKKMRAHIPTAGGALIPKHAWIHANYAQYFPPRNGPIPYLTDLPSYIQKLPESLPDDAVKSLLINGACIIPETEIHDHLLHSYVNHAYWDMPLLDVNRLRMCVHTNTEDNQVSLLLFQAVMFAGACSTDSLQPSQLGFATMREVREVFYNRVKILYEIDYERDIICVIQSLLLMTL